MKLQYDDWKTAKSLKKMTNFCVFAAKLLLA
jgi:hypothetical protein